jgi:hypothetical protein
MWVSCGHCLLCAIGGDEKEKRADNPHDDSARVDVIHRAVHNEKLSTGDKGYLFLQMVDV